MKGVGMSSLENIRLLAIRRYANANYRPDIVNPSLATKAEGQARLCTSENGS